MNVINANYFGALAILSWGGLGLLGTLAANLSPYLILAVSFGIAGLLYWKNQ